MMCDKLRTPCLRGTYSIVVSNRLTHVLSGLRNSPFPMFETFRQTFPRQPDLGLALALARCSKGLTFGPVEFNATGINFSLVCLQIFLQIRNEH
jgi:hypothetical protein